MRHTWEVRPGSWQGWHEVRMNGVSLGQFSHYSPAGALQAAIDAVQAATLPPFYQSRAAAARQMVH